MKYKGDSPVETQFLLSRSLEIMGTSNIIFENGQMICGYVPSDELLKLIKTMSD